MFEGVKRYKAPVLDHLYMMMVVLANIAISNSSNTIDRLVDVL